MKWLKNSLARGFAAFPSEKPARASASPAPRPARHVIMENEEG